MTKTKFTYPRLFKDSTEVMRYYLESLSPEELHQIVFSEDIDAYLETRLKSLELEEE